MNKRQAKKRRNKMKEKGYVVLYSDKWHGGNKIFVKVMGCKMDSPLNQRSYDSNVFNNAVKTTNNILNSEFYPS